MWVMATNLENLKALALLFSLSLLYLLPGHHSVEAAPTGVSDEGAVQLSPPPSSSNTISLVGSNTKSYLDPGYLEEEPAGPTVPSINAVVTIDEGKISSTTESPPIINKDVKLPNSNMDTNRETEKLSMDAGSKSVSTGFLLYEVQRDILGLSLDDINYVLDFGPEVFAFSLADKLGYLKNSGDDTHISVIEANKEQLMEKLNILATKMKQDVLVTEESTVQEPITTTPVPKAITESTLGSSRVHIVTTAHKLTSTEASHRYEESPNEDRSRDISIHDVHGALPDNPPAAEEKPSDIDDEFESATLFKQMLNDDMFLAALNDENKELYLKLNQAEQDKETASTLLSKYRVWLIMNDQQEENSNYGASQYDYDDKDPMAKVENATEANGGQEVKPEVEQDEGTVIVNDGEEEKVELEGGDTNISVVVVDGSEKEETVGEVAIGNHEPVKSSSFGAVHFLTIFIILGATVVTGYLCLHSRKKIREGVGLYFADAASKRRKRAREYKPVKQAVEDIE